MGVKVDAVQWDIAIEGAGPGRRRLLREASRLSVSV